jgi:hypothetical protein
MVINTKGILRYGFVLAVSLLLVFVMNTAVLAVVIEFEIIYDDTALITESELHDDDATHPESPKHGGKDFPLTVNEGTPDINGETYDIATYYDEVSGLVTTHTSPTDNFYVPLRFMANVFGFKLDFNPSTQSYTLVNQPMVLSYYDFTLVAENGGNVTQGTRKRYAADTWINITATPNSGYAFSHWVSSDDDLLGNAVNDASIRFFMPNHDLALTAYFKVIDNTLLGKLNELLNADNPQIIYDALKDINNNELMDAMLFNPPILALIKELEIHYAELTGNSVVIKSDNFLFPETGITQVGSIFNTPPGFDGALTLQFTNPFQNLPLSNVYDSDTAVRMNITLEPNNITHPNNLIFPVMMTIPVSTLINMNDFYVLHYWNGGWHEIRKAFNTQNRTATFVTARLSPWALANRRTAASSIIINPSNVHIGGISNNEPHRPPTQQPPREQTPQTSARPSVEKPQPIAAIPPPPLPAVAVSSDYEGDGVSEAIEKPPLYVIGSVRLNDRRVNLSQMPFYRYGSTYIPLREIMELLGFSAEWDENKKEATFKNGNGKTVITVEEGSRYFYKNGFAFWSGGPAERVNGILMMPFKEILDSIGCVAYRDENNNMLLSYSVD